MGSLFGIHGSTESRRNCIGAGTPPPPSSEFLNDGFAEEPNFRKVTHTRTRRSGVFRAIITRAQRTAAARGIIDSNNFV